MLNPPVVISFYTENTPYQLEVMRLMESCVRHGVEYAIVGLPSKGSWELNCAMKPFFIRDKLREFKRPVFWVDADAAFKKSPDFSQILHSDLALREMKRFSHDPRFKFHAGSLFFNHTPRGLAFVDSWCAYCQDKLDKQQDVQFLDQTALAFLIDKGHEVKICGLPIAYCKVFDMDAMEISDEEVVIEHYQASRRFRFWENQTI